MFARKRNLLRIFALLAAGLLSRGPTWAAEVDTRTYKETTLDALKASPSTFKDVDVQFVCRFNRIENLYGSFYTPFTPENYLALSVWSPTDRPWIREERARVFPFIYMRKSSPELARVVQAERYSWLEIRGTILNDFHGTPWILANHIRAASRHRLNNSLVQHLILANEALRGGGLGAARARYQKVLDHSLGAWDRGLVLREVALLERSAGNLASALQAAEEALEELPGDAALDQLARQLGLEIERGGKPRFPAPPETTEPGGETPPAESFSPENFRLIQEERDRALRAKLESEEELQVLSRRKGSLQAESEELKNSWELAVLEAREKASLAEEERDLALRGRIEAQEEAERVARELAILQTEGQEQQNQISTLEALNAQLGGGRGALEEARKSDSQQLSEASRLLEESTQKLRAHERALSEQSQIDKARSGEFDALTQRYRESLSDLEVLRPDRENLAREVERLQRIGEKQQKNIVSLERALQEHRTAGEQANAVRRDEEAAKLAALAEQKAALEQEIFRLRKGAEVTPDENFHLQTVLELDAERSRNAELSQSLSALEEERAQLLRKHETESLQLRASLEELEATRTRHQEELATQSRLAALQSKEMALLRDAARQDGDLRGRLDTLQREHESFLAASGTARQELQELRNALSQTEANLSVAQSVIAVAQRENDQFRKERELHERKSEKDGASLEELTQNYQQVLRSADGRASELSVLREMHLREMDVKDGRIRVLEDQIRALARTVEQLKDGKPAVPRVTTEPPARPADAGPSGESATVEVVPAPQGVDPAEVRRKMEQVLEEMRLLQEEHK